MIIGLTGGIGSGKTTVAKVFEGLGCSVFYSDVVAKDVYRDERVRHRVIGLLGPEAYRADGTIDRAFIGSKIFSSGELLSAINEIIHPEVRARFEAFKRAHVGKTVVYESALIFESGTEKQFDYTFVVVASEESRIRRVMKRDGLTMEQVLSKMACQMSQEEKVKRANFVVSNNEGDNIIKRVKNLLSIYSK